MKRKRKSRSRKHRIERCVKKLKGREGINPYAICIASINRPKGHSQGSER